ncbi:unnamed protein product [Prunus armeniaca]
MRLQRQPNHLLQDVREEDDFTILLIAQRSVAPGILHFTKSGIQHGLAQKYPRVSLLDNHYYGPRRGFDNNGPTAGRGRLRLIASVPIIRNSQYWLMLAQSTPHGTAANSTALSVGITLPLPNEDTMLTLSPTTSTSPSSLLALSKLSASLLVSL